MCGLVGVAGDISSLVKGTIFKDMLDVCQVRGRHSTGVVKVENDLEYNFIKNVGPPASLFDRKSFDSMMVGDASVLIGHCRHKTSGALDVASAHPFEYEEEGIIGVHNGTLKDYTSLDGYAYNKVDSNVLYGHLAKSGPENTFNKITGAWACVWWNNKEKTLNFLRNDERPLWFTWNKDQKMMFWASEKWMFGVISRKVELWDGGETKQPFVELPINTLWSFNVKEGKDKKLTIKPTKKIEPKKQTFTNNYNHAGYGYNYNSDWKQRTNGSWTRVSTKKGGEVTDPFQKKEELNDKMPENLKEPQKKGNIEKENVQSPSKIGNVAFLNTSTKSIQESKPSNSSSNSKRNTLSLPSKNSKTQQSDNSEEQTSDVEKQDNVTRLLLPSRKLVDYRVVAGMEFITDMKTQREFDVVTFEKNTKGICCFCNNPIGDLKEVAQFLNDTQFLCTSCVSHPKISTTV